MKVFLDRDYYVTQQGHNNYAIGSRLLRYRLTTFTLQAHNIYAKGSRLLRYRLTTSALLGIDGWNNGNELHFIPYREKKKREKATRKWCFSSLLSGAGGDWTLVQTRKPYAFYMLIPAFGFRAATRPGPPIAALSSKNFIRAARPTRTIPDFPTPRIWTLRDG